MRKATFNITSSYKDMSAHVHTGMSARIQDSWEFPQEQQQTENALQNLHSQGWGKHVAKTSGGESVSNNMS